MNSTAVPFGAGAPLTVTVAVTTDVELINGEAFDTASDKVVPEEVVPPPDGVLGVVTGGAVGDSPLHAAKIASKASTTKIISRRFVCAICTPVNSTHPHCLSTRAGAAYEQPPQ